MCLPNWQAIGNIFEREIEGQVENVDMEKGWWNIWKNFRVGDMGAHWEQFEPWPGAAARNFWLCLLPGEDGDNLPLNVFAKLEWVTRVAWGYIEAAEPGSEGLQAPWHHGAGRSFPSYYREEAGKGEKIVQGHSPFLGRFSKRGSEMSWSWSTGRVFLKKRKLGRASPCAGGSWHPGVRAKGTHLWGLASCVNLIGLRVPGSRSHTISRWVFGCFQKRWAFESLDWVKEALPCAGCSSPEAWGERVEGALLSACADSILSSLPWPPAPGSQAFRVKQFGRHSSLASSLQTVGRWWGFSASAATWASCS